MAQIEEDMKFLRKILPTHYRVEPSKEKATSIHCVSNVGVDETYWGEFMKILKLSFGARFQEVYHNTCYCHTDFTIHLK